MPRLLEVLLSRFRKALETHPETFLQAMKLGPQLNGPDISNWFAFQCKSDLLDSIETSGDELRTSAADLVRWADDHQIDCPALQELAIAPGKVITAPGDTVAEKAKAKFVQRINVELHRMKSCRVHGPGEITGKLAVKKMRFIELMNQKDASIRERMAYAGIAKQTAIDWMDDLAPYLPTRETPNHKSGGRKRSIDAMNADAVSAKARRTF